MTEQEPTADRMDAPTRVEDRRSAASVEARTATVSDRENDVARRESTPRLPPEGAR